MRWSEAKLANCLLAWRFFLARCGTCLWTAQSADTTKMTHHQENHLLEAKDYQMTMEKSFFDIFCMFSQFHLVIYHPKGHKTSVGKSVAKWLGELPVRKSQKLCRFCWKMLSLRQFTKSAGPSPKQQTFSCSIFMLITVFFQLFNILASAGLLYRLPLGHLPQPAWQPSSKELEVFNPFGASAAFALPNGHLLKSWETQGSGNTNIIIEE